MEEKENIVNKPNTLVQQKDLVDELLSQFGDLNIFPDEILLMFIEYLYPQALGNLSATCREGRRIVNYFYEVNPDRFMKEGHVFNNVFNNKLNLPEHLEKTRFWLIAKRFKIGAKNYEKNSKFVELLVQLRILELDNCRINGKLLKFILKHAPNLEKLVLKDSCNQISTKDIKEMSHLEELILINCSLADRNVEVAFSESLHTLELSHVYMKNPPSFLYDLKNLKTLHIFKSQFKDVPELNKLPTLKSFILESSRPIKRLGVCDYSEMSQLKTLTLPGFGMISDSQFAIKIPLQLKAFSSDFKNLVEVSKNPSQISSLESIGITSVGEQEIEKLKEFLSSFTLVTKIKSISFKEVDEKDFKSFLLILGQFQNLEELTIGCGDYVSQKQLEKLLVTIKSMTHLKKLHLSRSTKTVIKTSHFQFPSSLEVLSLGFAFNFKDESCDLSQLKSLKSLELNYYDEGVSEVYLPKGLSSVAETLESINLVGWGSETICNVDALFPLSHLTKLRAQMWRIPLSHEEIQAKFPKLAELSCPHKI